MAAGLLRMADARCRLSDLTDLKFFKENLDSTLFPGVPDSVEVHNGFGSEHAKTAAAILTETQKIISEKNATQVMVVSTIFLPRCFPSFAALSWTCGGGGVRASGQVLASVGLRCHAAPTPPSRPSLARLSDTEPG